MTIRDLDRLLVGLQARECVISRKPYDGAYGQNELGIWHDDWGLAGSPGSGASSSSVNGEALSYPVDGAIKFENAAAGKQKYLACAAYGNSGQSFGPAMLMDRLWHAGGFDRNIGTAQSITSPTWPARDANGSTDGVGVQAAIYMVWGISTSGLSGANFPIVISYTNSSGTSGRTADLLDPNFYYTSSAMWRFRWQVGDVGIRSIQSLTLSASMGTSSTTQIKLMAYRPLWVLQGTSQGHRGFQRISPVVSGLIPVWDNSVLCTAHYSNSSSGYEPFAWFIKYAEG